MQTVIFLIVIGTSIWVLFDAKSIGIKKGQIKGFTDLGPWGWFFVCLLLWIVGFPIYLSKRGEYKRINAALPAVSSGVAADTVTPAAATAGTRKCPWCAETIQAEAKICRFCNRELAAPPAP